MSTQEAGTKRGRIDAIDFTKGMLVLLMVVYHSLNYLDYGTVPHDYLGFVPASFILITGFLVSVVYLPRTSSGFGIVANRLAVRALKLLVIFSVLNLAARLLLPSDHFGAGKEALAFFYNWVPIYVLGNAQGVAFEVLLPISYTLAASILFLHNSLARCHASRYAAVALLVICIILQSTGSSINNLNFFSAGIIGIAIGSFGFAAVSQKTVSAWTLFVASAIYLAILLYGIDNYQSQVLITLSWLIFLYALGFYLPATPWWYRQVTLLGRYSLFAYIAQIFFLQASHYLTGLLTRSALSNTILLCILIGAMTWISTLIVDMLRPRSRFVDRLYNLVFA
jgi:hypothetical protein